MSNRELWHLYETRWNDGNASPVDTPTIILNQKEEKNTIQQE